MKVLVTGSTGLCGSALKKYTNPHNFHFTNSQEYDLRSSDEVNRMFVKEQPDYVIHAAARVGGIVANMKYPEDFLYDNLLMNANVIRACVKHNVQKLFAFSSVCVFSDNLTLLEEDKINDGPVYEANASYGYAKRMVDAHILAAIKQHKVKNWCSIIPGNIFGEHDMFSIENGHIVPAVMHKMFLAKSSGSDLKMMGDGLSLREFIYVGDLARLILKMLDLDNIPDKVIISGRKEMSIRDIVEIMAGVMEYKGSITWESSGINGQRSRPSSKKRIDALVPNFDYTSIEEGLKSTWAWFETNYPNIRTRYSL